MSFDEITVVIPAFNEQDALPLVLRDLPTVGSVIVVNNGSTDHTGEVASAAGAIAINEPKRGYGSACLAGLKEVAAQSDCGKPVPSVVVFLDADYSDHPDQLPELVRPIIENRADFVLGSRIIGEREPGAMPPQSLYGNRLACWLMRRLFGARYTDLGPFRAIGYPQLCSLQMSDQSFGWTVEMQIKAAKANLRTLEVPVRYRRRVGASKISGTIRGTITAGTKILYTIAKHALWQSGEESSTSGRESPLVRCDSTDGAAQ